MILKLLNAMFYHENYFFFLPLTAHEFTELQTKRNEELTKSCELFFDTLDNIAEAKGKHRNAIWPLQMMLLVMTPKVLEEIHNADSGAPCSSRHTKKRQFIDSVRKALLPHGGQKKDAEAAVVCIFAFFKSKVLSQTY